MSLPKSRKTRGLLAYLALAGRPQRRDRLVALLWDLTDDPRAALRWSLSKIRPLVDEDGALRVVADRETVAFDSAGVEIDLLALRDVVAGGVDTAPMERLRAAAEACRGDFLEGLDLPECHDFHAWQVAEREEARRMGARVLEALRDRSAHEPDQALDYARELVELDPYDETARAALVRLLARSGRRREAEEQYRLASRVLDEGGQGAAELRRVWSEVRAAVHDDGPAPGRRPHTERVPVPEAVRESGDEESADLLSRPAVAVLPFENLSGDPEQEYFADGMTIDVILGLSYWRWFPVIARSSAFAYKGRHVDAVVVGRELGARYIVQGSVRRAGRRVRVDAHLIDAESGHHVWARRYDGEIEDIFALQDEITEQIVTQIEPELSRAERKRAQHKPPRDLDAWDLNQRALALIFKGRPEAFEEALRLLDESLTRDSNASHTYALKGLCLYHKALMGWTRDPISVSGSYLDIAQKAVELDQGNWLAHALLSMTVLWHRRDYDAAARAAKKAVELNPAAALARQFLGCVYQYDGHPEEAVPHLLAALQLNPGPESAPLLLGDLSLSYLLVGEYKDAVTTARRAIGEFAGDVRAWQRLAAAYGHLGQEDDAARALAELLKRQKRLTPGYIEATYPFRYPRDREIFLDGLRKAGWTPE